MEELLERVREYNKEGVHYEAPYLDTDDMEKIEKALEKRLPTKPIDRCMFHECPSCGNVEIQDCSYCPDCGQSLDLGG